MQLSYALNHRTDADWASRLQEDGYCVIRNLMPVEQMSTLSAELTPRFERTPFCEGLFNGFRTKRFHGLLKRSQGASALVMNRDILDIAEELLLPFCDRLQLNLTQAVEIYPGELPQIPHRDQDMWGGEKGRIEYMLNVMWPLSPYTPENGSTRIWPGSHDQRERSLPEDGAVALTLVPGDALLFLGSSLHGAGANRAHSVRRGVLISYCLGWLKPYENMWLTYPPQIARHFPPELQALIGYCCHRPNLGSYDGQCPSVLFRDEVPEHLAATDALSTEHRRALAGFAAQQVQA